MDILIISIAQIGFTLLCYFAYEKGNVLYKVIKPVKLYFAKKELRIHRQMRANQKGAIHRLHWLYFWQKPIYDCPLCMLFWYGSFLFLIFWLTGFALLNMWLPSLGCAYGILLGYSFIKDNL